MVWSELDGGVGGRSRRQGDEAWSGGNVELMSERLVYDVHNRVLETLLREVAERRQSTHRQVTHHQSLR